MNLSLIEIIHGQISEEEKKFQEALYNGKSPRELKEIEIKIEYLKSSLKHIRYNYSSRGDLKTSD
jgi:hypothetical protein